MIPSRSPFLVWIAVAIGVFVAFTLMSQGEFGQLWFYVIPLGLILAGIAFSFRKTFIVLSRKRMTLEYNVPAMRSAGIQGTLLSV